MDSISLDSSDDLFIESLLNNPEGPWYNNFISADLWIDGKFIYSRTRPVKFQQKDQIRSLAELSKKIDDLSQEAIRSPRKNRLQIIRFGLSLIRKNYSLLSLNDSHPVINDSLIYFLSPTYREIRNLSVDLGFTFKLKYKRDFSPISKVIEIDDEHTVNMSPKRTYHYVLFHDLVHHILFGHAYTHNDKSFSDHLSLLLNIEAFTCCADLLIIRDILRFKIDFVCLMEYSNSIKHRQLESKSFTVVEIAQCEKLFTKIQSGFYHIAQLGIKERSIYKDQILSKFEYDERVFNWCSQEDFDYFLIESEKIIRKCFDCSSESKKINFAQIKNAEYIIGKLCTHDTFDNLIKNIKEAQ